MARSLDAQNRARLVVELGIVSQADSAPSALPPRPSPGIDEEHRHHTGQQAAYQAESEEQGFLGGNRSVSYENIFQRLRRLGVRNSSKQFRAQR